MGIAEDILETAVRAPMADGRDLYAELIAPLEERMMRTIWRVVRHDQLAEDVLQDALAIIWRKRVRVRSHPNPQALILKICLDCAYDALRKQERQRRLLTQARLVPSGSQDRPARGPDEEQIAAEVLRAIGRLPRNQALAVLMRIVQDEPYGVIAKTLGCRESTARIHVLRGRRKLGQWLAGRGSSDRKETKDGQEQRTRA